MKSFLVAIVGLISLLTSAYAQQEADEQYIVIYGVIQQAENLSGTGEPRQELTSLADAQAQLQRFQKMYPQWNPGIINYRLENLTKKISEVKAQIAAASAPVAPINTGSGLSAADAARLMAADAALQAQLQTAQADNQTLQAKLKEALSSQPAAINADELARAQEQIRSLMKENDLLKAAETAPVKGAADSSNISQLRRQLADAFQKYADEHARSEKLVAENTALQRDLRQTGGQDATALDLLRSENDRMKSQLTALQSAASDAASAKELAGKLKDARTQIVSLQTEVKVVTLEKGALEHQVVQLSAEVAALRAANFEGRIRDLTEQRDELAQRLAAGKNTASSRADAQLAALEAEMKALRARVAVDEAKTVPYTADELALFRQTVPQPNAEAGQHSIHELPAGTADLVVSAQRHFSNHEYDQAEEDYQKILEHDQNNGLVLANLATIELQQNQLDAAEKHITAALVQSPDDAYNLSTYGYLKFRQDKYDEALDALSRAAKINPNNPEIQNYLGVTLSHKGLRIQAETALRKAIQLNPLYAPAHNNLAVIYLSQTPPSPMLARWHYQKALAAGQPRNADLEKILADKGAPVD